MMMEKEESLGQCYLSVGEKNLANLDHVNWKTAPRIFKLYRGCPQIALRYARGIGGKGAVNARTYPSRQEQIDQAPTCEQVGQLLANIYGLTRHCRTTAEALRAATGYGAEKESERSFFSLLRRPVPSGGGLFPCEVYLLVGQGQSLPPGVYHYDAVHHALDILRTGDYSAHLQSCLARQKDDAPTLALVLSCFFWKSGYKYAEFGYRLQSLDVGVVIAQSLLVAGCEGWQPVVHYQFLDAIANQLLGLDDLYESTYAIVSLCMHTAESQGELSPTVLAPLAQVYMRAEPVAEPSISIAQWPLLKDLHKASLITTPAASTAGRQLPPIAVPAGCTSVALPPPDPLDMLGSLHRRHSAMRYFKRGELTQRQMSAFLMEGTRGYANDLDSQPAALQHTLLYCIVNAVAGIQPGIYVYHPERRTLELLHAGDTRAEQQGTLTWFSHNMWNVSVCVFPVADYEQGFTIYGDRWYRIQNMEAGILIQRLYLVAAALELGCQVNLGYHARRAGELLRLPAGWRCLAQILIAPEEHAGQYYEQVLC